MQADRPAKLIDPVCGMTVDVAHAEEAGLLLEYEGRTYAFCRAGCKRAFVESPEEFATKAQAEATIAVAAQAAGAQPGDLALPVIDEGMRRWYESCSCCLSDAYPEIKARLDAEQAAKAQPVPEGICEIAEAGEAAPVPAEAHAH